MNKYHVELIMSEEYDIEAELQSKRRRSHEIDLVATTL